MDEIQRDLVSFRVTNSRQYTLSFQPFLKLYLLPGFDEFALVTLLQSLCYFLVITALRCYFSYLVLLLYKIHKMICNVVDPDQTSRL